MFHVVLGRNGAQKSVQLKVQWPSMPTVPTVQAFSILVSYFHIDLDPLIYKSLTYIMKKP